jgi:hypothetical protein
MERKIANFLKELIELEHNAIEIYEIAINRLKNDDYKKNLQNLRKIINNMLEQ